ncbi:hypothetical protein HY339_02475 [Candidatus Gottesmanbacteria bacterium]|nr:hypothetical protein [Candidatus Gottesmanbacteria bacterium]
MNTRMIAIGLLLIVAGTLLMVAVAMQPLPAPTATTTPDPTQTARVEYVVVTATQNPALGVVQTDSVAVIAHRSETIENVVTVFSINAVGWGVYGYPCPSLKGVHFLPSSGGITYGQEGNVWIEIDDDAMTGYCQGEIVITFLSKDNRTEKHTVKFQLTVLP